MQGRTSRRSLETLLNIIKAELETAIHASRRNEMWNPPWAISRRNSGASYKDGSGIMNIRIIQRDQQRHIPHVAHILTGYELILAGSSDTASSALSARSAFLIATGRDWAFESCGAAALLMVDFFSANRKQVWFAKIVQSITNWNGQLRTLILSWSDQEIATAHMLPTDTIVVITNVW